METVRTLLRMPEVDVNQSNDMGTTSLHCAVFRKRSALVAELIAAGADIETKDERGRSPLHWACRSYNFATVKLLVEAGADVCVTDNKGDTCLTLAAYHGRTEIVRYLVGFPEVDVNHRTRAGRTALQRARKKPHADVVQVLLEHGASDEPTA